MGANNAIVAIGTRWHENDLFGKLLDQDIPGEHWTHLRFPAIDEEGNALCPDLVPLKELEISRLTDPREWQALYMGDPTPDVGVYFERKWLQRGTPPAAETMKIYGASDYAVTDDGGDYTVHLVVGVDPAERMWVLDLWRKQTSPDKWIPPLLDMMQRWKPIRWAEESGQIEKSVGPFLLQGNRCVGRSTATACSYSASDKPTRARAIQGRVAMRGLWLPTAAPWADDAESELLKFPTGKHDDIVDTLSLIGRMIAGIEEGSALKPDQSVAAWGDHPQQAAGVGRVQTTMALDPEVKTSDRSQHWLDEIERYEKASRDWREDAKKIIDRYRLERSNMQSQSRSSSRPTFNILWSNIQTMKPALFARIPEIIAERRHRDRDPVGRIASEVIQRAANEEIERNGFKDAMDQVVLDVLLVGRGVPWVRFEVDEMADEGMANETDHARLRSLGRLCPCAGAFLGRRRAARLGGAEDFAYQGRGQKALWAGIQQGSHVHVVPHVRDAFPARAGRQQGQIRRGLGDLGRGQQEAHIRGQGCRRCSRIQRPSVRSDRILPLPQASLRHADQRRLVPDP